MSPLVLPRADQALLPQLLCRHVLQPSTRLGVSLLNSPVFQHLFYTGVPEVGTAARCGLTGAEQSSLLPRLLAGVTAE